ncbi:MAG: group 1 truncated hemoglobin [Deltaproteobacteria bacterium]|nr:group 1 truncated hemoglobin [Deltaproteobacteria bacterium]
MRLTNLAFGLTLALGLAACKGDDAATDSGTTDDSEATDDSTADDSGTEDSLYVQLGGETAIRAVVAEMVKNIAADGRINWMFANADLPGLENQLHDQICAATGGGCTYSGADMKTAHAGMAITDAQFNALVEDLLTALDTLGVPYALDGSQTIDPLLLALVGMQGDIVEDADGSGVYFNQLGVYAGGDGHAAVSAVIDAMLGYVAADARINSFFATTDLANLRALLIEQVCDATGGYCTYSGRDMVAAHAGLCIGADDFNALVDDLLKGLTDLGVPYAVDGSELIDPLLFALLDMQEDIVEECK